MGTKSPFGVLQPRLPGAPLSERRDWSVLRRETPERTSVLSGEELARARTRERLESWATAGLKDEMEWILSVVRSMVYMKEGCIVGGERYAEKSALFWLLLLGGCGAQLNTRFHNISLIVLHNRKIRFLLIICVIMELNANRPTLSLLMIARAFTTNYS
jgi:hypothetical protein